MKTNTEPRTVFQTVRFTQDEAQELLEHAEACSSSVSQLVRLRVLGLPLPPGAAPAVNLSAWRELAATTSNLNQLVHHLNAQAKANIQGQAEPDLVEVKTLAIELAAKVQKLRLQLLGAS